ncbi:putative exopolysaccharide biosynthesis protein [Calothrix sp. NIES-4101]|nr:putative exopolysaccharide biosynthesis protein [Calothrix sp. NIES-4101]
MESKEQHIEEIDFHKYWLVLQRRWVPAVGVFAGVVTAATANTMTLKPSYKAEGSLLIRMSHTASLTGVGESMGRIESIATNSNPSDTQARIVASTPVIEETVRSLNLRDEDGKLIKAKDFLGKLKVEGAKGTDILQVSYQDRDPELAAKAVNKVIDTYIKSNMQSNRAEAEAAGKFIAQQLPRSERAVKVAESELRRFKESNKTIFLQEETSATVENIAKLEQEITTAQAQLADVGRRSQDLLQEVNIDSRQAVTSASLSDTPGVQEVLKEFQEAQSKLAVEESRFSPEHPSVINLKEKVTALNRVLQGRVQQISGNSQISPKNLQVDELRRTLISDAVRAQAERNGLAERIEKLAQARQVYKERANILPKLEQRQRELERTLKAAQTTYENLLTRLQEVRIAENQNVGNIRVVSYATPPDSPIESRQKLIIAGGIAVGTLLGIILAFGLDMIDRAVKTVREARELFQYTLLGVIPNLVVANKKKSPDDDGSELPRVIGRDIGQFPLGDAYQMLQANLKFLSSDKQIKSIVVTSSVKHEGKSEVAANLAASIAQVGQRVLLVDANMRQPIQHHVWGVNNARGLSNLIVDQVEFDLAVQQVADNLHLLSSGVIPPNSVALLDSQRMAALVNIFANAYDYVIFDTPPLAGTADAAVLGKLADGILLVVRPGVIDSASANAAKEFLVQSGQNVLGMVINGVNVKREPDSYFYYNRDSYEASNVSRTSVSTTNVSEKVR